MVVFIFSSIKKIFKGRLTLKNILKYGKRFSLCTSDCQRDFSEQNSGNSRKKWTELINTFVASTDFFLFHLLYSFIRKWLIFKLSIRRFLPKGLTGYPIYILCCFGCKYFLG